jgi:hypothetical protein
LVPPLSVWKQDDNGQLEKFGDLTCEGQTWTLNGHIRATVVPMVPRAFPNSPGWQVRTTPFNESLIESEHPEGVESFTDDFLWALEMITLTSPDNLVIRPGSADG